MCGIVGVVEPRSDRRAWLLRAMNETQVHRGPDEAGMYEDDDVALAMRRLAIIDVAHGAQPVASESGDVVAVFNGEVYNFRELRDDLRLKGHVLRSESDSECIPHLYEEHGIDFVRRLRGMFAIALWDRHNRRLVLARDRLGKKPLFYRSDGDGFAFASELNGLLRDDRLDRSIDKQAVSHYLTYQYVPAPRSIYASVRKVPPGHVLTVQGGQLQKKEYWRPDFRKAGEPFDVPESLLAEQFRELLVESVRLRLVSERPVGAFLSGGLDSSAVVAAMSRASNQTVRTFSIGFEDESLNELPFARTVAQHFGTEHHELVVRPDALEVLPTLARAFGEPFADSSAIPSHYLAEMTRGSVVVTLNGDGGDELLGGYARYLEFLSPGSTVPRTLRRRLRSAAARTLHGSRTQAPGQEHDAHRYGRLVAYFDPVSLARVLTRDFQASVPDPGFGLLEESWYANRHLDDVNRLLAVDTATYLPGDLLPKVDITTMQHSLEARSPLLDHHLVDWAAALPGRLKVHNGETKRLMKQALAPWLPSELITRRKQGFGVPLDAWMRGPLQPMLYDLLVAGRAVTEGWLDGGEVLRLVRLQKIGADLSYRLYALLMLELWMREVHEARRAVHV